MRKRMPSVRMNISEIEDSIYVQRDEDFEPNYVVTKDCRKIYRCKVVGTIVSDIYFSEDSMYASFLLDDSFGVLRVSAFRDDVNQVKNLEKGDIVQVVGKIRQWKEEWQVVLEALSKVEPNFILLHRLEILRNRKKHLEILKKAKKIYESCGNLRDAKEVSKKEKIPKEILEAIDELKYFSERGEKGKELKDVDLKKMILKLLEERGGMGLDEIVAELDKFSPEEIESSITELLGDGEIFEKKINYFIKVKE